VIDFQHANHIDVFLVTIMCVAVKSVAPLPDHQLLLVFETGERRVFDVKPYLGTGVFAALKDEVLFNSVHVSFDTIAWSNGADLCPEVLYAESTPVERQPLEFPDAGSEQGQVLV
jgi:hypothetical protein